ncbi:hypothetical protein F2P81_011744 [Scophthalmus maximus]|uniref:Uncharacterized protein n=1 Tax=Scophthalmus maximus TaxID=52904 RepID=A0A6A4T2H7_SCOMX|nr:hypothetical protein F2P81_011744 [Scophthalmus maximus]
MLIKWIYQQQEKKRGEENEDVRYVNTTSACGRGASGHASASPGPVTRPRPCTIAGCSHNTSSHPMLRSRGCTLVRRGSLALPVRAPPGSETERCSLTTPGFTARRARDQPPLTGWKEISCYRH